MKQLQRLSLYQVESIEGSRVDERGRRCYLVKWKDWEDKFNTWEPLCNLANVKGLILEFENRVEKQTETIEINDHDSTKQHLEKKKQKEKQVREGTAGEGTKKLKKKKQEGQREKVEGGVKEGAKEVGEGVQEAPVKRKRGRPKKTPLTGEAAQLQKLKKKKPRKPKNQEQAQNSKKTTQIIKETLSIIAELSQAAAGGENVELAPKVKSVKKRKQIRKSRAKPNLALQNICKRQQQVILKPTAQLPPQEEQIDVGDKVQDEQPEGIEQVLLRCKNYTLVKVTFKEGTFFYEIPFQSNGQANSIILTADEIIKINPKWLEGYFQGFHL